MFSLSHFRLSSLSVFLLFVAVLVFLSPIRLIAHATSSSSKFPTKSITNSFSSTLNCENWNVISSPSPGTSQNDLYGVAALSANNIWEVGSYGDSDHSFTLTQHWNGTSWNTVSSPNVSTFNTLFAVTHVPKTNQFWAVGTYGGSTRQTLTEHWDGTSWNIVFSPNVGLAMNELFGVTVISTTNVWAVGESTNSGSYPPQTLIEHWDGTSWSVVPSPNLGAASWLNGVEAKAENDIWAVGAYHIDSSGVNQSLIEHWDGTSWSIISDSPGDDDVLNAVTRVPGTNQLWAVGYDYSYSSQGFATLPQIEHWNGTSWSTVPYPTNFSGALYGVAAISNDNVWAVGDFLGSISTQPFIEHWNGTSWNVITSPNPGEPGMLNAIVRIPASKQLFAVGYFANSSGLQTLTEANCS